MKAHRFYPLSSVAWSVWGLLVGIALYGLPLPGRAVAAEAKPKEAKPAIVKGISYLPEEGRSADDYAREMCRLDLYRPEGSGKGFPTVVYYHGGGLTAGERCVPIRLTNRGWAVVGVGYRLHPKVNHPVYI